MEWSFKNVHIFFPHLSYRLSLSLSLSDCTHLYLILELDGKSETFKCDILYKKSRWGQILFHGTESISIWFPIPSAHSLLNGRALLISTFPQSDHAWLIARIALKAKTGAKLYTIGWMVWISPVWRNTLWTVALYSVHCSESWMIVADGRDLLITVSLHLSILSLTGNKMEGFHIFLMK